MEKVSVIVPFYNGNSYLPKIKSLIDENYNQLDGLVAIELIIVNDSPWIEVDKEKIMSEEYDVKIVNQIQNGGIHQARVSGIKECSGDYILMLDQDDKISNNCIKLLYSQFTASEIDCVIGNGVYEVDGAKKLIFNTYGKAILAKDYKSYLIVGNLVCSPGQCLIRKKAIPKYWCDNIIKSNCSDDLFLWCLLMKKKNVVFVNEVIYLHVNTGTNLSLDKMNGYKSDKEVLGYLKGYQYISRCHVRVFEMRCQCNIEKIEERKRYSLSSVSYQFLLNAYKIYMRLISLGLYVRGEVINSKDVFS